MFLGDNSLMALKEDPRSLFYHRKALQDLKLVTKQVHHQKTQNTSITFTGTLLTLKRFHVNRKSKYLQCTEKIVEYLKTRPNGRALYDELKNVVNPINIKKLLKLNEFQLFVRTQVKVPYREIYPDAPATEWKVKNTDREKYLKAVELIDPEKSVQHNWPLKNETEDNVNTETDKRSMEKLNYSRLCLGKSYSSMASDALRNFGAKGCTQTELGQYLGVPRLLARSCCRNLMRANMAVGFMDDVGRQRVTRYLYRAFENEQNSILQKFNVQKQRTLELIFKTDNSTKDKNADQTSNNEETSLVTDSSIDDGSEKPVEEVFIKVENETDDEDSVSRKRHLLPSNEELEDEPVTKKLLDVT